MPDALDDQYPSPVAATGPRGYLDRKSRVLNYVTSRRIVRTTPAASGTATQKRTEIEICGT